MNRTIDRGLAAVIAGLMIAVIWLTATMATGHGPQAAAQIDDFQPVIVDDRPTGPTGQLGVLKHMDGPVADDIGLFNFQVTAAGEDDPDAIFNLDPQQYGASYYTDLAVGDYVLTELVDTAAYDTEIECYTRLEESEADPTKVVDVDSASAAISIVEGSVLECHVYNTDLSVGELILRKESNVSNDLVQWDFTVGPTGGAPGEPFSMSNYDSQYLVVAPGTYQVTELETDANASQFTNVVCVDYSTGEDIAGGDDLSPRQVDVVVTGGETVECTFYNQVETGEIEISKITAPNFQDSTPFSMTLTGPVTDAGPGEAREFTLDTDSNDEQNPSNRYFEDLPPGTYTIEEDPVDGWSTTITCYLSDNREQIVDGTSATIELGRAGYVSCDVENTDVSAVTITVAKFVQPAPLELDTTVFNFGLSSTDGYSVEFPLDINNNDEANPQQQDFADLAPGAYTLTEQAVDGYTSVIDCTRNGRSDEDSQVAAGEDSVSFDAEPGDRIYCSVTNLRDVATVQIYKSRDGDVEDPEGGFAFTLQNSDDSFDESFALDSYRWSPTFEISPGEYTLTEVLGDLADDYETSISCDYNNRPAASINVDADEVTFEALAGDALYCYVTNAGLDDMSALGSIVVRKQVAPSLPFDERDERDFSTANATPSSAEQFPFRISGPGPMQGYGDAFPYEFSLYGSDQRYFNDLQAGTYTIEELDNGGLETSIECYNQFRRKELVSPEPIVTIASGMTVDVELAAGQSLDCVFTNTDPARAIISVEKDVAPGYNDPTDFTFTIEGPESFTETFVLDDDNLSSFVEARRIFDSLMPGDYKITEEQIAGYVTAVTCYEVSSFGNFSPQLRFERIGAPFVDPIATSTNGIVEFSIEGGETVFCDFVNRVADATLIVVKDDTGDTGTDVPITVTERGVVIATGIVSDNGTATTLEVPIIAGFGFTLTETVPVGFTADATSTTCVDQDGTSIIREDSDIMYYLEVLATPESAEAAPTEFTAHVFGPDVQPGDTVTCTLVNDPMPGSITVTKVSDTADGTDFSFALSGPASDSFVLDDDDDATVSNTKTISNLAVGTYTLVETAPGYTTEIVCVDPDSGTTTAGATATIDLDAAESISCTYTNTKITTGTIVIVSDTAPDGPQDFTFTTTSPASNTATALPPGIVSFAAGFTLDDDGDETTMPRTVTFTDLDGGVHTVTGIAVPGYTSAIECNDPDGGTTVSDLTATIDLDATEVVTCTFTHTANTGDGGAVGQILPSPADDEPIVDTASPAAAATTGAVVTTGGLAVTGSESAPVAQIALATVGIGLSVIAAARTRRRLF